MYVFWENFSLNRPGLWEVCLHQWEISTLDVMTATAVVSARVIIEIFEIVGRQGRIFTVSVTVNVLRTATAGPRVRIILFEVIASVFIRVSPIPVSTVAFIIIILASVPLLALAVPPGTIIAVSHPIAGISPMKPWLPSAVPKVLVWGVAHAATAIAISIASVPRATIISISILAAHHHTINIHLAIPREHAILTANITQILVWVTIVVITVSPSVHKASLPTHIVHIVHIQIVITVK